MRCFWRDWLVGPLRDVVDTVRAGDGEGVIVTHESVKADLDVRVLPPFLLSSVIVSVLSLL